MPLKNRRMKAPLKERKIAKYLIHQIWKYLKEKHPEIKGVDSNIFHFIIYDINKKAKLGLTKGWYYWGPYLPAVDDVLVEEGMMEEKYHQMRKGCDFSLMNPLVSKGR